MTNETRGRVGIALAALCTLSIVGCNCGTPAEPDAGSGGGSGGGFVSGGGGGAGGGGGGGGGGGLVDGGSVRWVFRFPGGGFDSVAADADGGVIAVGYITTNTPGNFGGGTLFSDGGYDISLVRFSQADGHHLWSKLIGGPDFDVSETLLTLPQGGFIITGSFKKTVAFGPLTGQTLTAAGTSDMFIAAFETDGTLRWVKPFGSTTQGELAQPVSSALDADGNVLVIALLQPDSTYESTSFGATQDAYLLRINPATGALISGRELGCNSSGTRVLGGLTSQSAIVECEFSQQTPTLKEVEVADGGTLWTIDMQAAQGARMFTNQLIRTDGGLRLTLASDGPITVGGVGVDAGFNSLSDFHTFVVAIDESTRAIQWGRLVSDAPGFGRSGVASGADGTLWTAYDEPRGVCAKRLQDEDGGTLELVAGSQVARNFNIVQQMAADGRGGVYVAGEMSGGAWTIGGKTLPGFAPDGGSDSQSSFVMKLAP